MGGKSCTPTPYSLADDADARRVRLECQHQVEPTVSLEVEVEYEAGLSITSDEFQRFCRTSHEATDSVESLVGQLHDRLTTLLSDEDVFVVARRVVTPDDEAEVQYTKTVREGRVA